MNIHQYYYLKHHRQLGYCKIEGNTQTYQPLFANSLDLHLKILGKSRGIAGSLWVTHNLIRKAPLWCCPEIFRIDFMHEYIADIINLNKNQ